MNSSLRWRFCEKESIGVEHFGGREVSRSGMNALSILLVLGEDT